MAVGRPVRQALTISVEEPGEVQAIERTPIFARIPGYVAEVLVDMNDRVHKGQVLARLDVPEVEAEYLRQAARVAQAKAEVEQAHRASAAAEANLATARARIQEAEAGRTRARANLERWQSEHQRIKKLVERGVVDSETRDETLNELKAAESARDETEAKVTTARAAREESAAELAKAGADVTVAEARLQVAEADQRLAQSMLDYREIKAPFDGLVSQRHVHTGHLLKAGTGDGGEPPFVLVRTDRARIFVEVPEAEAVFVRPGSPAAVRTRACARAGHRGQGPAHLLDPGAGQSHAAGRNRDAGRRPGSARHVCLGRDSGGTSCDLDPAGRAPWSSRTRRPSATRSTTARSAARRSGSAPATARTWRSWNCKPQRRLPPASRAGKRSPARSRSF